MKTEERKQFKNEVFKENGFVSPLALFLAHVLLYQGDNCPYLNHRKQTRGQKLTRDNMELLITTEH